MDKYDETHRIIANMAGVKMRMNSHKGNIEDCCPAKIIKMLKGEVTELEEAIASQTDGDLMHIIEEAADCFNFLVAVTHQQVEKYRGRKEQQPTEITVNTEITVDKFMLRDTCTWPNCACTGMKDDRRCLREKD